MSSVHIRLSKESTETSTELKKKKKTTLKFMLLLMNLPCSIIIWCIERKENVLTLKRVTIR